MMFRELFERFASWWRDKWDRTWFRIIAILMAACLAWAGLAATGFARHVLGSDSTSVASRPSPAPSSPAKRKSDASRTKDAVSDDARAVKALRERAAKAGRDMQALLTVKSGDDTIALLIRNEYATTMADGSNPLADSETTLTNLIKTHASDADGITDKRRADRAVQRIDEAYDSWSDQVWTAAGQQVDALASQYASQLDSALFAAHLPDDRLSGQCVTLRDDLDPPVRADDPKTAFDAYAAWRDRLPVEYEACAANLSEAMTHAAPPSNGKSQVVER